MPAPATGAPLASATKKQASQDVVFLQQLVEHPLTTIATGIKISLTQTV